jgi:Divergent InlB B-repeat domain
MLVKLGTSLVVLAALVAPSAAPQSLLIQVSGSGSGKITGPGIECPSDCRESYLPAVRLPGRLPPRVVTLTATPAAGTSSQFQRWGESCATATGPTCTLTLTPNPSGNPSLVTAIFVGPTSTPARLTVSIDGSGKVTGDGISCPGDCSEAPYNSQYPEIRAQPFAGWKFAGWSGACSGASSVCRASGGSSASVTARFEALPPSSLQVSVQGPGKVTGPGIDCPSDCDEQISAPIMLTAVLEPGQKSMSWGPPCNAPKEGPESNSPSLTCHVANTGSPISVSAIFGR